MKVRFLDIWVRSTFYAFATLLSVIFSFVFVFVTIPDDIKIYIAIAFGLFLLASYIVIWIYANHKKHITIKIRNTRIIITEGDIFAQEGKKIIPANEYFDTIVDDKIIAKTSLHGQYITNYVKNIKKFDWETKALEKLTQKEKKAKKLHINLEPYFKKTTFGCSHIQSLIKIIKHIYLTTILHNVI